MKSLYQFILVWLSVLAYAQPSGACSEGTTRIDASGHLYGCVVDKWIKISEDFDVATATYSTTAASTGLAPANNNVMLRVGDKNYQLPNRGFVPILPSAIADAPSHVLGKVFYSKVNKHFYQGVDNGKWHQIDNEGFSSTKTGTVGRNFTKNNCGTNYTGSSIYVTRTASGTATSTISQADADSKAQALANSNALALVYAEGQAEANSRGTCTYNPPVTTYTATRTETVSGLFSKLDCPSGIGSAVTVSRQATATATSTVSQADANSSASRLAQANAYIILGREGQAEANRRGTCTTIYTSTRTASYSQEFEKDCTDDMNAGRYDIWLYPKVRVYRSATATATSTISQADADQKAYAQALATATATVRAEGQAEANRSTTQCGRMLPRPDRRETD